MSIENLYVGEDDLAELESLGMLSKMVMQSPEGTKNVVILNGLGEYIRENNLRLDALYDRVTILEAKES